MRMRRENVARLEVATNAAKSSKYQSLHAKFRTLLFLFTITVVDFGTYSHISYLMKATNLQLGLFTAQLQLFE